MSSDSLMQASSLQALGVFGLCQIHAFIDYIRSKLSKDYFEILFKAVVFTILSGAALVGIILTITGTLFICIQ